MNDVIVGIFTQDECDYHYSYNNEYLSGKKAVPISFILPLHDEAFHEKILFPFFDDLIPEGWLLDIGEHNWKLNPCEQVRLLLVCCKGCIGSVSVISVEEKVEL